jgi:phage terminase large subunit
VHWLHGEDNPHLPPGALARLLKQYGPHERAARARGEWTTLEGRIYADFSRATHVVKTHQVPAEWPIYFGVDFGTRAPFAAVVCALDPADDTLHVVDEWYQADYTLSQHAAKLHQLIAKHGEPRWIVCDPEDKGSRLALSREHGLVNVPARKGKGSVRKGINDLCERIAFDVEGKPHLVVHDQCTNLIHEFESYVWDERGVGESRDQPKPRQRDHALDALRYCVMKLAVSDMAVG